MTTVTSRILYVMYVDYGWYEETKRFPPPLPPFFYSSPCPQAVDQPRGAR